MVVSRRWLRAHGDAAGVEEREAAGAVGRLDHAGLDAGLADRRRLLVARHAEHRHRRAEDVGRRDAELAGIVDHRRQHRLRHAEQLGQLGVPGALADVEQQGAAGVGGVARMDLAAGQPPQQEALDRAGRQRALLGRGPRAGDVLRGSRRSWCRRNRDRAAGRSCAVTVFSWPARFSSAQHVGGAAILPDDGVVHRLAGRAVPHHRRLALVGDADAGQRLGRRAWPWPAHRGRPRPWRARSPPDRARPSRAWGRSAAVPSAPRPPAGPWNRTRSRACWSCPGRWRGYVCAAIAGRDAQCARSMAKSTASSSAAFSGESRNRPSASRAMAP